MKDLNFLYVDEGFTPEQIAYIKTLIPPEPPSDLEIEQMKQIAAATPSPFYNPENEPIGGKGRRRQRRKIERELLKNKY